jgi:excisionase family DNA binding protein
MADDERYRHGIGHNGGPRFDGLPDRLLYDIREACRLLGGIGRSTLYKAIQHGRLKPVKIGARTMLPRAELERFAGSV